MGIPLYSALNIAKNQVNNQLIPSPMKTALTLLALLTLTAASLAQPVPQQVNYQGRLTANGTNFGAGLISSSPLSTRA